MFRNWQYRLLALALALTCWYIVAGREKVQSWIEMPVEIVGAKPEIVVEEGMLTKIGVRVRGPRALVRGLEEKRPAYTLDLSDLEPGETEVSFSAENIPLSMALEVIEIDPPRMTLVADRLVERTLPVTPVWKGSPGQDYDLVNASTVPDAVSLTGPEKALSKMESVSTRPLAVNATGSGTFSGRVGLDLPDGVTSKPDAVNLQTRYEVKLKTVWIKLPVAIRPENDVKATVRPHTIQIRCGVPLPILRQDDFKKDFLAYVLLPSGLEPGSHSLPLRLSLPEGCALEKVVPEKVEVRVKKG